jgi:hypothetical protein
VQLGLAEFFSVPVIVGAICAALAVVGNLLALAWFGMWMGLTSKGTTVATLKTIVFVQVLPSLVVYFASMLAIGLLTAGMFVGRSTSAGANAFMTWWPLLTTVFSTLLHLVKDACFILWSRNKLHSTFRERAGRFSSLAPAFVPQPPLAVPPVPPP